MKKIILLTILTTTLAVSFVVGARDIVGQNDIGVSRTCAFHGIVYDTTRAPHEMLLLCPLAPASLVDQYRHDTAPVSGAPPKDDDVHNEECYSSWFN